MFGFISLQLIIVGAGGRGGGSLRHSPEQSVFKVMKCNVESHG